MPWGVLGVTLPWLQLINWDIPSEFVTEYFFMGSVCYHGYLTYEIFSNAIAICMYVF